MSFVKIRWCPDVENTGPAPPGWKISQTIPWDPMPHLDSDSFLSVHADKSFPDCKVGVKLPPEYEYFIVPGSCTIFYSGTA